MNTRNLTEMDDFYKCVELMKKDGRGEITPSDVFRVDTIGAVYEYLDRGYVIGIEDGDGLVGLSRISATLEPDIHWIHELFGDGVDILFEAVKKEGQKRGASKFVWLQNDEWLKELNDIYGIEPCTDPDVEILVNLNLDNNEIKKEEISIKDLKLREYCKDPVVTNITNFEELEKCVKIQNDVGWGDISAPARILKPEMLSEHFSVPLGIILVIKEDDEVVAFARLSTTFTKGVYYGHELALMPLFQGAGIGKFVMSLIGEISRTLMKDPDSLDVIGKIMKKVDSISDIKLTGTVDPLNAKMLGLATGKVVSSIGAFSRGVYIAENLYGKWDTQAHGSADTDRLFWIGNIQRRKLKLGDYPTVSTEAELESIDEDRFYIELPNIDMDMSDVNAKNKVTRMLVKAINERGYTLTHVNSRGTPRYLLERLG